MKVPWDRRVDDGVSIRRGVSRAFPPLVRCACGTFNLVFSKESRYSRDVGDL